MVWSLLLLIVVTLLGVAGISTSIFEERMAANEALHKQSFYEADGGSDNALALLVNNINCIGGFGTTSPTFDDGTTTGFVIDAGIGIAEASRNFWVSNNVLGDIGMPTDSDYDFVYPSSAAGTDDPRTLGRINGQTRLMTGAALQMLAGYEGKGKGIGSDGAFLEYDLKVEHIGTRNSRTGVSTLFRLDNQFASYPAGSCYY